MTEKSVPQQNLENALPLIEEAVAQGEASGASLSWRERIDLVQALALVSIADSLELINRRGIEVMQR